MTDEGKAQAAALRAERDRRTKTALETLEARIEQGSATYADAQRYAGTLGDCVGDILCDALAPLFPIDGDKSKSTLARELISALMHDDYTALSALSARVQVGLNRKAGIGLEAAKATYNGSRVNGIIKEVLFEDDWAVKRIAIRQQIENAARAVVDDTVRENAGLHYRVGMQPKVTRVAVGECCQWCRDLAGSYNYPDEVPDGFYRRHTNCNCLVLYQPSKGTGQDVHTKRQISDPSERIRELETLATQRREASARRREELHQSMRRR